MFVFPFLCVAIAQWWLWMASLLETSVSPARLRVPGLCLSLLACVPSSWKRAVSELLPGRLSRTSAPSVVLWHRRSRVCLFAVSVLWQRRLGIVSYFLSLSHPVSSLPRVISPATPSLLSARLNCHASRQHLARDFFSFLFFFLFFFWVGNIGNREAGDDGARPSFSAKRRVSWCHHAIMLSDKPQGCSRC